MDTAVAVNTSRILIVGSGKLATELLENLQKHVHFEVLPWGNQQQEYNGKTIVVHAGSGRELDSVIRYCSNSRSILVELSTSGELDESSIDFPTILCSNTNILVLRFLAMLRNSGHHFSEFQINILESHQSTKTSKPGTALSIASFLNSDPEKIISVRDPKQQHELLSIAPEHLSRHAYHKINITDGNAEIELETKVLGNAPYSPGLGQILRGIQRRTLDAKVYDVVDLVCEGWI